MKNRCPDSKLIGKGVLENYYLDFLEFSPRWQGGCADVIPKQNSEVWGLVYKVSKKDILKLDGFEGHPNFYKRISLNIKLSQNKIINAEVYMLVNKKPFNPPTEEYFKIIIDAAINFDFPAEYQNQLKKFEFLGYSS